MNINTITAEDLRRMPDKEGLILQGCGGDLTEWVDGINEMLTKAGILKDGCQFENVAAFQHGELTCLLYPFDDVKLDIGKLALWRLQTHEVYGGTWLSDFVPNYLGGCHTYQQAFSMHRPPYSHLHTFRRFHRLHALFEAYR